MSLKYKVGSGVFRGRGKGRCPPLNNLTKKCAKINVTESRASNRLQYRSGLGSGSAKIIFSGLAPVQVFVV